MLRGKIIDVYSENRKKHITHCEKNAEFLGAFANLRKATISFVISVRPHETTGLPRDGFSLTLIFEHFLKSVEKVKGKGKGHPATGRGGPRGSG